jgi:hypothetical protein
MLGRMWIPIVWLATSSALSLAGETPQAGKKLLAMPVVGRVGVAPAVVTAVNEHLASELRRIGGYQAITMTDVEQMLTVEMRAQLVGCDSTGCLAEVAGALNTDEVLHGSVARLSSTESVLTLTRLDAHTLKALGAEAARLDQRRPNAMMDAVSELLLRLYPSYEPPSARATGLSTPALGSAMFGLGLVMQWGSFATALTTPCWVWACPPALFVAYPALVANFLLTPVLTSYAMTAMGDVLGRRVAPWRSTLKAGLATLLLGFLAVPLLQGAAGLLGCLGALPFALVAAVGNSGGDPIALVMVTVFLAGAVGMGAVFASSLPIMMGLMGATVLAQVITFFRNAEPRPLGQEPHLPTLYAPEEKAPGFLGWLPDELLGGGTGVEPLEEADVAQPSAPAAPQQTSPPSEKPAEPPPVQPENNPAAETPAPVTP